MNDADSRILSRKLLFQYFLDAATPREHWQVGMELEKMGRTRDGAALTYDTTRPSVRSVLEWIHAARGGNPVLEGDHLIGLDAPWGSISLEPGGQVEWSSRPQTTLGALEAELREHLLTLRNVAAALDVVWLEQAFDATLPLEAMPWMPKARYELMRPFLGSRGRLAQHMMTQTASIQVAYDYADGVDWTRKFRLAALLAPVATALFANSPARDAGVDYRAFRQAIWRETDPARCGIPAVVFDPAFDLELWLDYLLDVPTIFRHRGRGLVPTGGVPFRRLLRRRGSEAVRHQDWETHLSTIFTEVRSYGYIEVRCTDLQLDDAAFDVPTFWTGLLYDEQALAGALELVAGCDDPQAWAEAMDSAAREGLAGRAGGHALAELATEALKFALRGLRGGAACVDDRPAAAERLSALAERNSLVLSV